MIVLPPAGTREEIAARVASLDDVTYAGLDADGRARYLAIADLFLDLIGDDDYHWGCTAAEVVDDRVATAWNAGWEKGFATSMQRIIDGLATLEKASMVEAEVVVEIVPRIRRMHPWDTREPLDADDVEAEGV